MHCTLQAAECAECREPALQLHACVLDDGARGRWRWSLELNWLGCLPFDVARVSDGNARIRIFIGRLKACGMHWMAQRLLHTPTSPRYGAHPPEQHPSSIQPFVEEFGEACCGTTSTEQV